MIHLERVSLPDGLRAVAYRDRRGNLVIYVSDVLDARGQRAAIREAIRASRRAGWRNTALIPVGAAIFLGIRALLGQATRVIGLRSAAVWGAAAAATVLGASAAAVFVLTAPHARVPATAARPPASGTARPSGQPAGGLSPGRHRARRPVAAAGASPAPGRPASSGQPRPAPTSAGSPSPGNPSPAPAPSPTVTQPAPGPSPSPSSAGSAPVCVIILGVRVCLAPISLTAGP